MHHRLLQRLGVSAGEKPLVEYDPSADEAPYALLSYRCDDGDDEGYSCEWV